MSAAQPALTTARLLLRAFTPADAPAVRALAGDPDVASTTAGIPHPYDEGMAEQWISTHAGQFAGGTGVVYAITARADGALIGAAGLAIDRPSRAAELGYWVGRPFWGKGYATEAASALVGYGFSALGLVEIHAHHMLRNPASGRVLEKVGMAAGETGEMTVRKSPGLERVRRYSITSGQYRARRPSGREA